jgi:hypothetical protein
LGCVAAGRGEEEAGREQVDGGPDAVTGEQVPDAVQISGIGEDLRDEREHDEHGRA